MKEDINKFKKDTWFISDNMDERTVSYIYNVVSKLQASGAFRDVDEGSIYLLASQFDIYVKAMDKVMDEGTVIQTMKGPAQHPGIIVASKAFQSMQNIIKEYGLTARSAEKIKSVAPKEELSPLQQFMQDRNDD